MLAGAEPDRRTVRGWVEVSYPPPLVDGMNRRTNTINDTILLVQAGRQIDKAIGNVIRERMMIILPRQTSLI